MTIETIANRLVELCRKGEFETAQRELFSEDAKSIEPHATPEFEKETTGLPAILEKNKKFDGLTEEVHSLSISEPLIAGNSFVTQLTMDITMKKSGRIKMEELCVYDVKDGKIIAETFHM